MAPERDDPLRARTQAKALQAILRRSGWYDRASLQEAAYRWAATGLPLNVIEGYLTAGIADPGAAEFFTESGDPDQAAVERHAAMLDRLKARYEWEVAKEQFRG